MLATQLVRIYRATGGNLGDDDMGNVIGAITCIAGTFGISMSDLGPRLWAALDDVAQDKAVDKLAEDVGAKPEPHTILGCGEYATNLMG